MKDIEKIINDEIREKYGLNFSQHINDKNNNFIKNFLKFSILRYDIKIEKIKINNFLKMLRKLKNDDNDLRSKKELIELINTYLGISEVERSTFGEVSTPIYDNPGSVDEQLKLLDNDFWENPYVKILDPSSGIGNYEVVILTNFMKGLKDYVDDKIDLRDSKNRYKWIMENIIYIVDINPKNIWLYYNIFDEKNKLNLNYYLGSFLEPEFDEHMKNVWKIDEFDLVTTNPPYNKSNSTSPIYHMFIDKSLLISNNIIMITPSRWFSGGRGLDNFRKNFLLREDIKNIKHIKDEKSVFGKNIEISGGVSYFYINKNYTGKTLFETNNTQININLNKFDILPTIINELTFSIIEKISHEKNYLSDICQGQSWSKITSNDNRLKNEKNNDDVLCYVSLQKGIKKYIKKSNLDYNNIKGFNKFKIFTSRANGAGNTFTKYFYDGIPSDVCTQSYIVFLCDSEQHQEQLKKYLNTKFARFLLSLRKISQDIKPDTCKWIPLSTLTEDEKLYKFFNLTQNEIDLIEKTII